MSAGCIMLNSIVTVRQRPGRERTKVLMSGGQLGVVVDLGFNYWALMTNAGGFHACQAYYAEQQCDDRQRERGYCRGTDIRGSTGVLRSILGLTRSLR